MGDRWDVIPADTFMEILQRLPPSPRRRLRLVCRHWRTVIDDRVPGKQARAKVLAFAEGQLGHGLIPRAFVIDDLTEEGTAGGRDLKLQANRGMSMVGTCNGLLCLHRNNGDVVVVNPATGEKLAVPPPSKTSGGALCTPPPAVSYSFAYHPATGLYKIVHLRCDEYGGTSFDAVDVFTLGDRSWREVPVPAGTSCLSDFGLVSTGGATYWVAKDAHHSLMSLDLKDEHVVVVAKLPVRVGMWHDLSWHLTTDVSGGLGLAVCSNGTRRRTQKRIHAKVWMLEEQRRKKKRKWVLQYKTVWPGQEPLLQEIAGPLTTDGEHLLATRARWNDSSVSLMAYRLGEARAHCGMVPVECALPSIGQYGSLRTFAHVETTEPLALYAWDDDVKIGDNMEWVWKFDSGEGRWKFEVK